MDKLTISDTTFFEGQPNGALIPLDYSITTTFDPLDHYIFWLNKPNHPKALKIKRSRHKISNSIKTLRNQWH